MKTLFSILLLPILTYVSNAQNVYIYNTNFKEALISQGVDTSGDGEISYAEAEAITVIDVSGRHISDMTGIEAFVNLEGLWCSYNQLTSLDVSGCTALEMIRCDNNQLNSLDVSGCTALEIIWCNNNQLNSLDVSSCIALTELYCYLNQLTSLDVSNNNVLQQLVCCYNQLTSLDVSKDTALIGLDCCENQLTSLDVSNDTALRGLYCSRNQLTNLDVSNNINLSYLILSYMQTLHKVCVWEMPFPPVGTNIDTTNSPNVYFTTDCSATALKNAELRNKITIYPNPVFGIGTFTYPSGMTISIEIYDISGILLKTIQDQDQNGATEVDFSDFKSGVYPCRLIDEEGNVYVGMAVKE